MLHQLTAGSLLAWFVIFVPLPQTLSAQSSKKQGKANESKISKQEAKVAEVEKDYYDSAETAKADLLARMDSFISYVSDAPGIAVDLRVTILDDLREAKSAFDKYSRFTAIPAFQGIYQNFAITLGKKYWSLMTEMDKLRSEYPAGDKRCEALEKRVKTLSDHYTHFDSLKPGSKWNGYRSDFKMPPRMELNPQKMGRSGCFERSRTHRSMSSFLYRLRNETVQNFQGSFLKMKGSFKPMWKVPTTA